jgi:hypothetical protein
MLEQFSHSTILTVMIVANLSVMHQFCSHFISRVQKQPSQPRYLLDLITEYQTRLLKRPESRAP